MSQTKMKIFCKENIKELEDKAKQIRRLIVQMLAKAGSGHPGGSLSSTDLIVVLYYALLRHDPKNPKWRERDRFHMSKGHCCPLWYAILADFKYFPEEELWTLRNLGSTLQGHPDWRTPGVNVASGSLGQGLSVSVGMSLAAKLDKLDFRVYCLLGDGEIQEGQIWESLQNTSCQDVNNIIAIVDLNKIQTDKRTEEIISLGDLQRKFEAFGWFVHQCDGHDMQALQKAFEVFRSNSGQPKFLIADTLNGKGVSFMEDDAAWHEKAPTTQQAEPSVKELEMLAV